MVVKNIGSSAQSHRYTTIARPNVRARSAKTNYGLIFRDYEDLIDFLKRLEHDPELISQIVELVKSEWRPANSTALDVFYERIRCSKCNAPRQLSPEGQESFDALIFEMKRFPVEKLNAGTLMQFVARLRNLEREYLDAKLGKGCTGPLSLSEAGR